MDQFFSIAGDVLDLTKELEFGILSVRSFIQIQVKLQCLLEAYYFFELTYNVMFLKREGN
jgi:hypothetical protein